LQLSSSQTIKSRQKDLILKKDEQDDSGALAAQGQKELGH
jgi:hypothetical protein